MSPTPAENLTKDSSPEATKKAIGDCISMMMREGRMQEQAIAMCHEMARKATGKQLKRKVTKVGK